MTEPLPAFRYHPDPLATGAVVPGDAPCVCCGRARGWRYVGPVLTARAPSTPICPWCIADGTAARTLGAVFSDSTALIPPDGSPPPVSLAVADEVLERTPGYVSWQGAQWRAHCGDACEFHGDASERDVAGASPETLRAFEVDFGISPDGWTALTRGYRPGGDSALHRFVCRHCRTVLFAWDLA
jgi:uncharacterized protein CbrC (UPF0167 family)